MKATRTIETPRCKLALDEHGIIWLTFSSPNVKVELEHSQAIVAARRELGGETQQLLCVDLTNTPRPSKASRDYTDSDEIRSITKAMAMVTPSRLSRVIGNFFLGFAKSTFPTKLFPTEEQAVAWLLAQPE